MRDYKENVKFQYLCRLADAMAGALKAALASRFQAHADNLLNMVDKIRSQKLDKVRVTEMLQQMAQQANEVGDNIIKIQGRMTRADMENGKLYAVQ